MRGTFFRLYGPAHRLASLLQEYRGAWPLIKSDAEVDPERGKALFAPHGEQAQDESVMELIRQRSDVAGAPKTYRSK